MAGFLPAAGGMPQPRRCRGKSTTFETDLETHPRDLSAQTATQSDKTHSSNNESCDGAGLETSGTQSAGTFWVSHIM